MRANRNHSDPDAQAYKELLRYRHFQAEVVDRSVIERMEIMFDLVRLIARLGRDFESVHRPRGWTWAGFRLMNLLWVVEDDLEPGDLAQLSGSSRASISSALNTLEASGYIERNVNRSNRRKVRVTLTKAGGEALVSAMKDQAAREQAWLTVLSDEERATLVRLLSRLAAQPTPE